MTVGLIDGGK